MVAVTAGVINFLGNPAAKQKDQQCAAYRTENFGHCHCVEHVASCLLLDSRAMYPLPPPMIKV
jgi:hypothetical protein